jgi:hypothetical protein
MTEHNKQPDLTEHLRQFKHNDGSGFVFAYDKDGIDALIASLPKEKFSIALNRIVNFEDMVAEYKQQLAATNERVEQQAEQIAELKGPRPWSESPRYKIAELNAEIAELVEYAKGLRAALVETDRQLETGFVRCETCGDQEDTATFDCRSWPIADALAKPMPKAMKEE